MNGSIDALIPSNLANTKNASTTPKSAVHTPIDDDNDEDIDETSPQFIQINNRIRNEFMSHCLSFLQQDDEARQCVHTVWNKYLQCVGDVSTVN